MKKVMHYLLPLMGYLGVLSLLKFGFNFYWQELLVLIGGCLGIFLLEVDYLLYAFVTRPDDPLSFKAQESLRIKNYKGVYRDIEEIKKQGKEFILHSYLFGPVIFVLTLFALTSSGSYLGVGLTMGMFWRYAQETLNLYLGHFKDGGFKERIFWNLKNIEVTEQLQKYFVIGLGGGFLLTTIIFLS